MLSGKRPDDLGAKDGRLARSKRTPNCVSSQAELADIGHYIAPITFKGAAAQAIAAAKAALQSMPRVKIVHEEAGYLYAECRSRLLGYVDDLEFVFDAKAGVLHVRSASRLGHSDLGVNRSRVEALRKLIAAR